MAASGTDILFANTDELLAHLGKMLNDDYMACHVDYYSLITELRKAGFQDDANS